MVIIGPSKGFGRALVKATLSSSEITRVGERCVFILITTNRERTVNTWNELYEEIRGKRFSDDAESGIEVFVEETDLGNTTQCLALCEILRIMMGQIHLMIDHFNLFLNAGTVTPAGPLLNTSEYTDPALASDESFLLNLQQHAMINFNSVVTVSRLFVNAMLHRKPRSHCLRVSLINVSSLAAVQEIYGLSIYGAIKAARDSILRSFCLEVACNFSSVDCKFLNYAPGLMLTDLVERNLLGKTSPPNEIRDSPQKYADPDKSAARCISLICDYRNSWRNGSHIDFYDKVEYD